MEVYNDKEIYTFIILYLLKNYLNFMVVIVMIMQIYHENIKFS